MIRRFLCVFLAVLMISAGVFPFSLIPSVSTAKAYGASNLYDISGHWAEGYIRDIISKGIISGYPNGTFRPDAPVTRAEFISMINKTLGNGATESIAFNDVSYNSWYYLDVSKAVAAGFVAGYDSVSFKPNSYITREEAAVIISRIVPTYKSSGDTKGYKDAKQVSTWATEAMKKVIGKGYMGAYDDGLLHPSQYMNRAQTAKIICAISSGETIEDSTKTIKYASTKLSGTIYSNGVVVSDDLGEGNATIENCVVLGNLEINGGGTNTLTVSNSRVSTCTVDKDSSSVRLLVSGESAIGKTNVYEMAMIETSKLSGGLYGTGFSSVNIRADSDLSLKGEFKEVNVIGNDAVLRFDSGTINTLNLERNSSGTEINTDTKATIKEAYVNGSASFRGKGIIDKMTINTSRSVTYETKPKTWVLTADGRAPEYSESVLTVAFSPQIGAKNVGINSNITLLFNSVILNSEGKGFSTSDIAEAIELRKKTSSGTEIEYTAKLDSTKKSIIITPKEDFEEDTKYYIKILGDYIKNADGDYLDANSSYFTTGDEASGLSPEFTPEKGSTGISLTVAPRISFPEAVKAYSGKTITEDYIKTAVELKEGSSSGTAVPFTASINSSKTRITIYPTASLKASTTYYLAVPENKFKTFEGEAVIPSGSVTWATVATAVTPTPTSSALTSTINATSTTSTVTPTVVPGGSGTLYLVLVPASSSAPSAVQIASGLNALNTAAIATANSAVTTSSSISLSAFSGLTPSTDYMIYGTISIGGTYSSVFSKAISTTALPLSTLTNISVAGSSSFTPAFSGAATSYTVKMPYGTASAAISATGSAGATLRFKLGADAYATYPGNTFNASIAGGNVSVVKIESSEAGKSTIEYTLNVSAIGNTSLTSVNVSDKTATLSGGTVFLVPAACASTTVTITATDPNATISCPQLTGTVGGTGSLAGTINLATTTTTLSFTLTSNQDVQSYTTYSIVKSD